MNFLRNAILTMLTGFSLILSAADGSKTYRVPWVDPGGDQPPFESGFQLWGPSGKDRSVPVQTQFRVEYNEFFWAIEIVMKEPLAGMENEPDNILELFFTPTDSAEGPYYQFYGSLKKKNVGFYPRGTRAAEFIFPDHVQFSYNLKPGVERSIRILFPWQDFSKFLPLPGADGKNAVRRFNIIRGRGNDSITWCGDFHRPETWGRIEFSAVDEEKKADLLRNLVKNLANEAVSGQFPFDPERYNNRAYLNWKNSIREQLPAIAADTAELEKTCDALPSDLYGKALAKINGLLTLRTFVQYNTPEGKGAVVKCPPPDAAGKPVFVNSDHGIPELSALDAASELYVTNLDVDRNPADLLWQVSLNGKMIASGSGTELPRHVKVGRTKAGDRLTVGFASVKKSATLIVMYALERLYNGMVPGTAVSVLHPTADDPQPWRTPDGRIQDYYLGRVNMQETALKAYLNEGKMPRLFLLGDSITDGFAGPAWTALGKYRPLNLGIGGDKTQNLLWRMERWDFERCRPELFMIMIGTNNAANPTEEIVSGIRKTLDVLRRKSPDSKILLLGVFPCGRGVYTEKHRNARINALISKFADQQHVFYMDIGSVYLDAEHKVRADLMPDFLHPNHTGYQLWVDAVTPALERFLPDEKKINK